MSVIVVWSTSNGGTAISDTQSHGSISNGTTTLSQEFFIRHDGANPITSAGLYIKPFSGSYTGRSTATQDYNELLSWGDSTSAGFGGVQFNLNATGSYPDGNWPTSTSKTPSNGSNVYTGVGDSAATCITLTTTTGCSSAGVIPAGSTPDVRFKMRVRTPTNLTTTGLRLFEVALSYTATS
jgi:hypothetical protein